MDSLATGRKLSSNLLSASAGSMLGLLFGREDGGDMFL
jgi:hypothetical protein